MCVCIPHFLYLSRADLFRVKEEVLSLAKQWKALGLALGLRSDVLERIEGNNRKLEDCLHAALDEWLTSVETLPGPPSWQLLLEAVANPADGNNQIMAQAIGGRHNSVIKQSKYSKT